MAMERALRMGDLPDDRSLNSSLGRLLERRRTELHNSTRWAPWVFGLFVVLSIGLAVGEHRPAWAVFGVFFAVFAVFTRWASSRTQRRFDGLAEQLRSVPQQP